ncbi:MAG: family 78 glycoside hydrolase catalytic domain [Clostridia bacterium]|nr:family 78 glycoside hydrolase catalytic domain [Clostridia bacterium]
MQNAKWIKKTGDHAPLFKEVIKAEKAVTATIDISSLGWFELYLNGKKVGDDLFTPAVSNYHSAHEIEILNYPSNDVMTKRAYYLSYELPLNEGENELLILLGAGFYAQKKRVAEGIFYQGEPQTKYVIKYEDKEIRSGENTLASESVILETELFYGETTDYKGKCNLIRENAEFKKADEAKEFDGEVTKWSYPTDKIIREITPKCIYKDGDFSIWDNGENITGLVAFDSVKEGEVVLTYAENLNAEKNDIDVKSAGGRDQIQSDKFIFGEEKKFGVMPHFVWHGFRYFSVKGEINNPVTKVIHSNVPVTSEFKSNNKVINWLFDAYKRSQLGNMHGFIPSDCPHRERLGYTGDGQVTCDTALMVLDSAPVYEKWMQDIIDSQNTLNGHIQHTAPFYGGGGGPCGWGGAVAIVPYFYYKATGSLKLYEKYLDNILFWFDYIDSRSDNGLVVREEEKGWCLGEWCIPLGYVSTKQPIEEPFVNTCYFVRCLNYTAEVCAVMGKKELSDKLYEKAEYCKNALKAKYYDETTGDYHGNIHGTNAYAIDIDLGDERTVKNMLAHYEKEPYFDTGFLGSEVMTRVLCKVGRADLAFKIMSSEEENHSFGYMMNMGATTIWEEFYGGNHSHNHHMFGGCVKLMFTDFLGIKMLEPGYKKIKIDPFYLPELGDIEGFITTEFGKIEVSVKYENGEMNVKYTVPAEIELVK